MSVLNMKTTTHFGIIHKVYLYKIINKYVTFILEGESGTGNWRKTPDNIQRRH